MNTKRNIDRLPNDWRPMSGEPRPDLFDTTLEPTDVAKKLARKPLPVRQYVVLFTARSGSSWLNDLMVNAGIFGNPGEFLNPKQICQFADRFGATNMPAYLDVIRRRGCIDGTFGLKVTPGHARQAFGTVRKALEAFPGAAPIFVLREDIVAQAVSLYLMRFQAVKHRVAGGKRPNDAFKANYDRTEIRNCLQRTLNQEHLADEAYYAMHLKPLRLSQERNLASDPGRLVHRLATHVGIAADTVATAESRHLKLGASINEEYAERFRKDEAAFIEDVASQRALRLSLLAPPA